MKQPVDGICPAHLEPEPCFSCANLHAPREVEEDSLDLDFEPVDVATREEALQKASEFPEDLQPVGVLLATEAGRIPGLDKIKPWRGWYFCIGNEEVNALMDEIEKAQA